MVSPLALDAVSSGAAARAGLRRAEEADFEYVGEDGRVAVPVVHPLAGGFAYGFEGKAKLVRLLAGALADVARQTWPDDGQPPADAALYLSLPGPMRAFSDLDLIASQRLRQARATAAGETQRPSGTALAQQVVARALPLVGWSALKLAHVSTAGRTGFVESLAAAMNDLEAETVSTAIVGGLDSQLDAETLTWLYETGRLKFGDRPVGVEPGEAAACLVLQRPDRRKPHQRALAWLAAAQCQPAADRSPSPLAQGLLAARRTAGLEQIDWLVSDADGTEQAASEVGGALVHLSGPNGRSPRLSFPAISFGDAGAATGAVASCLAVSAWLRRHAPSRAAFVATADRSQRAVHVLLAPE